MTGGADGEKEKQGLSDAELRRKTAAHSGMGNEIKLKKIERGALADMACYTHLLLVHDFRVLFEFFCIVFHDEAPFIFAVRKGCPV